MHLKNSIPSKALLHELFMQILVLFGYYNDLSCSLNTIVRDQNMQRYCYSRWIQLIELLIRAEILYYHRQVILYKSNIVIIMICKKSWIRNKRVTKLTQLVTIDYPTGIDLNKHNSISSHLLTLDTLKRKVTQSMRFSKEYYHQEVSHEIRKVLIPTCNKYQIFVNIPPLVSGAICWSKFHFNWRLKFLVAHELIYLLLVSKQLLNTSLLLNLHHLATKIKSDYYTYFSWV